MTLHRAKPHPTSPRAPQRALVAWLLLAAVAPAAAGAVGTLPAATATPAAAARPGALAPFSADYRASYMGITGSGRMQLSALGGNRWRLSLDVSAPAVQLRQATVFSADGNDWKPLSGDDLTQVLIKRIERHAQYDWVRGVATWSGDIKPERAAPVTLAAGDIDAMMLNLALVRDGASGKPPRYRVVDEGRAKPMSYRRDGDDTLTVNGKAYTAVRYVRDDGRRQYLVWIAPGLPAPARILQRKDGNDEVNLVLTGVR
jgi:hypothetical protein